MYCSNSKRIISLFSTTSIIMLVLGLNFVFAQGKDKKTSKETTSEIMFVNGAWKDIADRAKKRGKYIFVDAYTSWCGPCKQLKKHTFKDKEAAAYYNKHFINYAIDMEKGEGIELATNWDVMAYPTLLYFTPDGKLLMKQIGFVDGKGLIEIGKQVFSLK